MTTLRANEANERPLWGPVLRGVSQLVGWAWLGALQRGTLSRGAVVVVVVGCVSDSDWV